eukprot:gnl/MRDRNA2_/MRDRNA2_64931_c0_seq1.p1 gnl/MRDRNA2_/MRDRNA2_64931_c0~~gnl/MRDRNA2_/MRDRNA2_64931_c0_seq1.p1  ORF type:complete len:475 (-),score=45.17 gnl/MRDRNA2_/MRDRNA2_64931_c0_seq1:100-1524(-)
MPAWFRLRYVGDIRILYALCALSQAVHVDPLGAEPQRLHLKRNGLFQGPLASHSTTYSVHQSTSALRRPDFVHNDSTEADQHGLFLAKPISPQMGFSSVSEALKISISKSQQQTYEEHFTLQNLYWVLGAGLLLGLVTIVTELLAYRWESSSLLYVWFLALQCAGHLCMAQSIVHFGHQTLGVQFGPVFLSRGVIYLCLGLAASCASKINSTTSQVFWPDGRWEQTLVVLQGAATSLGQMMVIAALVYATAPVVSVILCSSVLFMALGSLLIQGETLKWPQWASMTLGIAVVTILIYATASGGVVEHMFQNSLNLPLGLGLAVSGALLIAFGMVIVRYLKGQVHYLTYVVGYGSMTTLFCVPLAIFFFRDFEWVATNYSAPLILVLAWQGICSFIFQCLMNKIGQLAKLGPVQTFINAACLVFLCVVDIFMGYRYQILAWICFMLTLVWLPLSYVIESRYGDNSTASSQSSSKD